MTLSTLALLVTPLSSAIQEPFPPLPPLFPLHGLGVDPIYHARAADLNGDGHVDVVTTSLDTGEPLRVHLGTGTGALVRDAHPPVGLPTGQLVRNLELGDFDGDGDSEPAVLIDVGPGSRILVFDNDGSGAMSLRETLFYFTPCDGLSTTDFHGDDFDDLAFTRGSDKRINVVRSLGPAGFAPPLLLPPPTGFSGPSRLVLGDTSGDGRVDVVSLHGTWERAVVQYLNDGAGGFHAPVEVTEVTDSTNELSLAEIRGDGVLHLATSDWNPQTGPALTWYENDGVGRFERRQRLDGVHLAGALADLDGDLREEWLVWRSGSGIERVAARGTGVALSDRNPHGLPGGVVQVADFDSDGAQDLLFVDDALFHGQLALARGDGVGGLSGVVASPGQGAGNQSMLVDLVAGTELDLVTFDGYPPRLYLYRGLGDGRFAWLQDLTVAEHPYQVVVGDFDGNGLADLGVVEGAFRSVELFLQARDGSFAPAGATAATQLQAGGYLNAVALDSDGDDRDELALLDPHAQRLFLVGLGDNAQAEILAALHIPGAREIHASIQGAAGGPEGLELVADGSASFLSLWVLEQPLSVGATRLTERLALPILDPAQAPPLLLVNGVSVRDLDGDGLRDVWAVHHLIHSLSPFQSASSWWRGDASVGFDAPQAERSALVSVPLWANDLDGDGTSERAYLHDPGGWLYPDRLQIRRAKGGAPFSDPEAYIVGDAARGDVDGDGRIDLVVAWDTWVFTLLNQSGR